MAVKTWMFNEKWKTIFTRLSILIYCENSKMQQNVIVSPWAHLREIHVTLKLYWYIIYCGRLPSSRIDLLNGGQSDNFSSQIGHVVDSYEVSMCNRVTLSSNNLLRLTVLWIKVNLFSYSKHWIHLWHVPSSFQSHKSNPPGDRRSDIFLNGWVYVHCY